MAALNYSIWIICIMQDPIGDIDFYFNGGEVQPYCDPVFDPDCSISAAHKVLTYHYQVSFISDYLF